MPKTKEGLGPVKRFGVRYGRTVKFKRAAVEMLQKASTKCPYCAKHHVKRISKGVWNCLKCGNKFTGQAYTFTLKSAMSSLPPIAQVLAEIKRPAEENEEATEAS